MKTKLHYLVNPGVVPSVTFVTCYEPVEETAPAAIADPTESTRKSSKRSWTQAVTHLPKVLDRFVGQTL